MENCGASPSSSSSCEREEGSEGGETGFKLRRLMTSDIVGGALFVVGARRPEETMREKMMR